MTYVFYSDILLNMNSVCIFEDSLYQDLYPLTFVRPVYDLLVGMETIHDRISRYFEYANMTLHCRNHLKSFVKKRHRNTVINTINAASATLFINGRVLMTDDLYEVLTGNSERHNLLFTYKGYVVAAFLRFEAVEYMKDMLTGTPSNSDLIRELRKRCVSRELEEVHFVRYAWDAITLSEKFLFKDFEQREKGGIIKGDIRPFSTVYNEINTFIDRNTTVEDFVVIDATKGPVYIEEGAYIESGSRLQGPLYIGKHCRLIGVRIKNSAVGDHCKIGGEVSESVMIGYSNKAHDGYLGNSYVGEWVNIGAGSTTSNLKNTYGPVQTVVNDTMTNTGEQFLGAIIGDHVKLGIGSQLNAGTHLGFGASLYGAALHDKYIPPFTWGEKGSYQTYQIDKFLETATRMMARREKTMTDDEKIILEQLHSQYTLTQQAA